MESSITEVPSMRQLLVDFLFDINLHFVVSGILNTHSQAYASQACAQSGMRQIVERELKKIHTL